MMHTMNHPPPLTLEYIIAHAFIMLEQFEESTIANLGCLLWSVSPYTNMAASASDMGRDNTKKSPSTGGQQIFQSSP